MLSEALNGRMLILEPPLEPGKAVQRHRHELNWRVRARLVSVLSQLPLPFLLRYEHWPVGIFVAQVVGDALQAARRGVCRCAW